MSKLRNVQGCSTATRMQGGMHPKRLRPQCEDDSDHSMDAVCTIQSECLIQASHDLSESFGPKCNYLPALQLTRSHTLAAELGSE